MKLTGFCLAFAAVCIVLSCSFSSGQGENSPKSQKAAIDDSSNLIRWQVRTSGAYLLYDGNEDPYLYINIKSGENKNDKKRVPLNISLVLDRSGSMAGDKIEYAKKAAMFVVDQLNSNDILSIVNYDDKVEVTSPSQPVKNKEMLKAAIDQICDRGSTNLSGGTLQGYWQVAKTMKAGYVNRVLLLTDGLANVGITDPSELKKLVDNKYKENGIALSTFGLGADYNEDLLTLLAETGRANYYFIKQADQIPGIFANELKGLLSVVAQNAAVSVTLPDGMECEKVYGYPYELKNNKVEIKFNDIYANDEKAVLIKLKPVNRHKAAFSFNCNLSYTDAETFQEKNLAGNATINLTKEKEKVEKFRDPVVQEMIAVFTSAEKFDEILADVDRGDYKTAKRKADSTLKTIRVSKDKYKSEKLQKQELQLEEYTKNLDSVQNMKLEDVKLYQKSNKSANYEVKKLKKQ
ncbi:vWA domain-containing protein [Pinibacter aurantiacus]|uniref:VWA domain-containing protein n=1 Tax=Pinibacter aurantiacus TaxID=2851599 RepID=A0A9E2SCR0_9BACT|nr:VWA domain-containing protein [Pinibacter aurantiacus]MBV4359757.1 VWA domain-containing protein [Pinibacter aurantiacus]